jgi:uncharacterized protein (DUF2249 family)
MNWLSDKKWLRLILILSVSSLGGLFVVAVAALRLGQQQVADPSFEAKVTHPAYKDRHPKVLFDEAHNNFQTTQGGYKPFVELITNDGYAVTPNQQKFQQKVLEGYEMLIIADALGTARPILPPTDKAAYRAAASKPAFTQEECAAVRSWVNAGGSLLVASDHAPVGAAMENLSGQFGVEMSFSADSPLRVTLVRKLVKTRVAEYAVQQPAAANVAKRRR